MASLDELRKRLPSLDGLNDEQAVRYLEQRYQVPAATIARNLGVSLPVPAAPPAPKRSLFAVANDTVIEAANAAAGTAGSIANFVSPGNRFSQGVDEFIREGEASQSDAVKADKARFRERMEGAQGFGDEVAAVGGYIADAPLQALAQAAGSIAVPLGGMRVVRALGGGTAAELGVGAAVGGAGAGGDAAGTAYELAKEAGATDEEATAAARSASVIPAIVGAAGGVVGAERLLAGAKGFGGNWAARAAKTAGVEGVQEGIEEGITQYEGQRAAVPFDPTIDPMKGVAGAAAMGVALGGAAGGGVSLLSPAPAPMPDKKAEADAALDALGSAGSVDEAVALATKATDIPVLPTRDPNSAKMVKARNAGTLAWVRDLDREDQTAALGLMAVMGNPRTPETVRRAVSAQLDALERKARAIPTGEASEVLPTGDVFDDQDIPTGEATELRTGMVIDGRNFYDPDLTWEQRRERLRRAAGLPPAMESTELLPTGEATEADPIPAGESFEDIPTADAAEVLPVGDAAEVLPTGEVIEDTPPLPTGEATDIEPEQADTDLLLTGDGMPYGTRSAAYVRAKREGLPPEAVVDVPGGWAVKKESTGERAQPDVAGTPAPPAGPRDGRGDNPRGSGVAVGSVPSAPGGVVQPAAGVGAGDRANQPVADASGADPALRIKALSAQWADAVARGDAAEAKRLNDAIVEARKPKEAPQSASGYTLPDNVGDDWAASRAPGAEPTPRQAMVMAAVEKALDDGVFYNRDMDERVAQELGVPPEMREPGKGKVEGGWFGYDVYLARQVVQARRERENETRLSGLLSSLKPGDSLGTLMFNDGKQVRSTSVEAIDGQNILFTGKRGSVQVRGTVSPSQLKRAIDRAHEREARSSNFDEFAQSLAPTPQPEPEAAPAAAAPARDAKTTEVIELRKRLKVLESIKRCVG